MFYPVDVWITCSLKKKGSAFLLIYVHWFVFYNDSWQLVLIIKLPKKIQRGPDDLKHILYCGRVSLWWCGSTRLYEWGQCGLCINVWWMCLGLVVMWLMFQIACQVNSYLMICRDGFTIHSTHRSSWRRRSVAAWSRVVVALFEMLKQNTLQTETCFFQDTCTSAKP